LSLPLIEDERPNVMYTTNVAFGGVGDCRLPRQIFPSLCYQKQSSISNASCCRLLFLFLARLFVLVSPSTLLLRKTLVSVRIERFVVCRSNLTQACVEGKFGVLVFLGCSAFSKLHAGAGLRKGFAGVRIQIWAMRIEFAVLRIEC